MYNAGIQKNVVTIHFSLKQISCAHHFWQYHFVKRKNHLNYIFSKRKG